MPSLEEEIPGLRKAKERAWERERVLREKAFLPTEPICGVHVLPLTPRHLAVLHAVKSPLATGSNASLEDCAQFLWIVSPDHIFPTPQISLAAVKKARRAWLSSILRKLCSRGRKLGSLVKAIRRHVDEAMFDLGKRDDTPPDDGPSAHFAAHLVDECAGHYGWLPQVLDARGLPIHGAGILDMPLAQLIQYRRCRTLRTIADAALVNPLSDDVELNLVRKLVAKEKAAEARKGSARALRAESGAPAGSPDVRKSAKKKGATK